MNVGKMRINMRGTDRRDEREVQASINNLEDMEFKSSPLLPHDELSNDMFNSTGWMH